MINFFKNFFNNKDAVKINNFKFSDNSLKFLDTVHIDLQKLANRALELSTIRFEISCGMRTIDQQIKLVADGKSKTYNSRHLGIICGLAIDVFAVKSDGKADWNSKPYFEIEKAFKKASEELKIPYEWGGNFTSFKDYVHFQLPKTKYPDDINIVKELKKRGLIK